MKSIIVIVLSFLLMSSCNTFEENNIEMATFTIAVPGGSIQLSGNPIIINATTTTTGKTSHQLLCRVTCTDGAIPGGPWIDSIATKNGAASFNISALVNAKFPDIYYTLKGDSFRFFERDALAASITVEIGESYIDTNGSYVETWDAAEPTVMTILKGKLPRHEFNILASQYSSFWSYYIAGQRWLTRLDGNNAIHTPTITVSSPEDAVKASFAVSANQTVTIFSVTYFSDGTYAEYYDPIPRSCVPGILYEVDIQKYRYNPDSKTITHYDVYAPNSGTLTNRIFSVIVDRLYHENHNILYFANSIGSLEVLHCYGDSKEEISTKSETVVSDSYDFSPTVPTVHISESSYGTKYTINTGFKSKQERIWIKDLLESETVLLQIEDSPLIVDHSAINLLPVTIVPGSYTINDTSDDLLSIEFQIQIAHEY